METVFENAPKKKRPRFGPCYQMEISFLNDDSKKIFLSRLDRAKNSLSSSGSHNVDNYRLLLSLLDHFEEEPGRDSDVPPTTISPAQRNLMLKHSGNSANDMHALVHCTVCVSGWMYMCTGMVLSLCFYNNF